jgi:hypothetical protein
MQVKTKISSLGQKQSLSAMTLKEIRDVMETSEDMEVLETCRTEIQRRLTGVGEYCLRQGWQKLRAKSPKRSQTRLSITLSLLDLLNSECHAQRIVNTVLGAEVIEKVHAGNRKILLRLFNSSAD